MEFRPQRSTSLQWWAQLVTVQLMALLGVHWQPSLVQPHFS